LGAPQPPAQEATLCGQVVINASVQMVAGRRMLLSAPVSPRLRLFGSCHTPLA
jgi:hypothetical protein